MVDGVVLEGIVVLVEGIQYRAESSSSKTSLWGLNKSNRTSTFTGVSRHHVLHLSAPTIVHSILKTLSSLLSDSLPRNWEFTVKGFTFWNFLMKCSNNLGFTFLNCFSGVFAKVCHRMQYLSFSYLQNIYM